jgi:hypothetical protein
VRPLFSANLLAAALALVVFLALALRPGLGWTSAPLFAAFGATPLLRWFARAYAYATGTPGRGAASDIVYAGVLLVGVGVIAVRGDASLTVTWAAMLLGTLAGFLPLGRAYLAEQFRHFRLDEVTRYAAVWRQHARWSLLGVVSTEATADAHVYIITLQRGPSAFAPLAASALLIRPITVAMNAVTEFERARTWRGSSARARWTGRAPRRGSSAWR